MMTLAANLATAFNALSADCVSPPNGLIGWWPGEGNANDIAGGHDGGIQNGARADGIGLVGQAFSFDGNNGTVYVYPAPDPNPNHRDPTKITVMAWVKFDSLDSLASEPGVQYILFKANGRIDYYDGYALRKVRFQGQDYFSFLVSSASGEQVITRSLTSVTTNVFYQVAGVFDGSKIRLYVNGVLEHEKRVFFELAYDDTPLLFGTSGRSFDGHFAGLIDEVAMWNRAVSSEQVAAVYAAGNGGMCTWVSITSQPQSQIGYVGGSLTFQVIATGSIPLSYQWQHDGLTIPSATNSTLVLTNLQADSAGIYAAVISSSAGRTISAPAVLTMNPSGVSMSLYAGVTIDRVVGQTYGIQFTTNLSKTNSWRGLTNLTLTTPKQVWYDPQPATPPPRFFRVVPGPISVP